MLTRSITLRADPLAHVVNRFMNDNWFGPAARDWATVWGLGSRLPIDIYEDGDGYTFVAVAPGLNADDVQIETQGNLIKLSGETIAPALSADEKVRTLRSEIGYGKFSRSFELPEDIQADQIEAKLETGVLTLRVPKAEAVKPRTIKVQAK
ncbi:MAG TPA: Hsp20/alpha crystallin family protein [Anaerolineae bacterium]|nr:Hsp20/alpha crystallin family protein [Anaerolineae bacterium]